MRYYGRGATRKHAGARWKSWHAYLLLLCAVLSFGIAGAAADDYPSRPIRLIVPFAPGGAVDAIARLIANPLGVAPRPAVVIYDRGGAGGSIGMDEVAKSSPDGYTLLLDHSGMTYMPGLYRKLPFDPVKDFDGVITAVSGLYVLAVNLDLPVKSVAELIAYAKANPGKLSYGSAGIGSSLHLAGELLQARCRRRHCARALQRRRAGGNRPDRRPDPDDVRSRGHHAAARPSRVKSGRWR